MQKRKRRQKHESNRISNIKYRMTNFETSRSIFIIFCVTCALTLAGCAKEQQYPRFRGDKLTSAEAGAVKPICVDNINKLQAMEIAEDILTKMHFTIEKADADPATPGIDSRRWRGFIRTRPLAGAQFFEFWRSDNVGADNWLESNLHSIRRVVELNMSEQDEGPPQRPNRLCINCDVQIYRLSLPERHVNSSARAYDMFSTSSPALQRIKLNPEQKAGMAWIDLGKDTQLAAEILKRIENRLKRE